MSESNIEVSVGQRYKHFKGNEYIVRGVARNCDNPGEILVVYEAQYSSPDFGDKQLWVRKLEDFAGMKVFDDGRESVKKFVLIRE